MDELKHYGFQLKGHPRLIRLNPFAPFKTRGNGAISFNLSLNSGKDAKKAKKLILNRVENLSELQHKNTNPGVVFYDGIITPELETYSMTTVQKIVTIENAQKLAVQVGAQFHKFKNGRGIIGALAAIGYPLEDRTYELLAYRIPENYGKKRKINYKSVLEMNQKTYPQTFDNLDEDEDYIAIEPHTPCPILYGIRGETPEAVIKAHGILKTCETIERIVVYATNQHTDNHLLKIDHISQMDKCKCYIAQGFVENSPKTIEGGHVIFNLKDDSGSIDCAAYEPTKGFRDVVKNLKDGDLLKVYGGIGNKGSLNLEKIHVLKLAKVYESRNPICECGKRMKSAGKNKGYKCMNCGFKLRYGTKNLIEVKRNIKKGFYEVPPAARRHLSKPLIRKY
jgi:tRNA(Ile2)-agmatinylcytidine synthase